MNHGPTEPRAKIVADDVKLYYGEFQALHGISLKVPAQRVTALIGPSGCGKSTFLRSLNRMNDLVDGVRLTGSIKIDGEDIYQKGVDLISLRRKVGMVFQKSNPFPKSIFENVAFGPRVHGISDDAALHEIVERSLTRADLWNEVKDRLFTSASIFREGNSSVSVSLVPSRSTQRYSSWMSQPPR